MSGADEPLPDPPLAPLTDDELRTLRVDIITVDGIPIASWGEDGEWYLAVGHLRQDRFVEAVNAHELEQDPLFEPYDEGDVRHMYAVVVERGGDEYEVIIRCRAVTADTPGAFPITRLETGW